MDEKKKDSCRSCVHYRRGKCTKKAYDDPDRKINDSRFTDPDSGACIKFVDIKDGHGIPRIGKWKALFYTMRPPLMVLGFLAPFALLAWVGQLFSLKGLLIVLAVGFYNVFANTMNEYRDRIDDRYKIGKEVPVLRCLEETKLLMLVSVFIFVVSLAALSSLNLVYGVIGAVGVVGGLIYNYYRKKDVMGNVFLGFSYAMAALICTYPHNYLFPVAFGLFTIAHNVGVQVQDYGHESIRTVPSQVGEGGGVFLSLIVALSSALLFFALGLPIFWLACAAVVVGSLFFLVRRNKDVFEQFYRVGARILLLLGFVWMLISSLI